EKEKADISKYSISGFAKDVLRIRDNLQLALFNSKEDTSAIIDGIKLTMSELDKILNNYGIKIIDSMGKPFDPHKHQAMIEIESKDQEPGIIVQVMQEGFMIHDRLLRPALVGVSKK
ncbi:MAG: nucleotide exchange factor GrpE, partial [Alphaproteobacteria bacterium]|nr:nucleotide exchange factor GrpE [Alphaproteobacteria bacterium]